MSKDAKLLDLESRLADNLRKLWEEAHGVQIGSARARVQADRVKVYLDGVLSQAERESLSSSAGQKLIEQYTQQLAAIIQPALQAQVESLTRRRVVACQIRPDLETDCLECRLILE